MSNAKHLLLLSALLLGGCASSMPKLTTMADGAGPGPTASATPKVPPRGFNVRVPDPDDLMGKDPAGLRGLMGEPSLLRKEGEAQVWQYAGTACVVFLYLYDTPKGTPQVTYLDARAKSAGAVPVDSCLDDVMRTRAAQGVS